MILKEHMQFPGINALASSKAEIYPPVPESTNNSNLAQNHSSVTILQQVRCTILSTVEF